MLDEGMLDEGMLDEGMLDEGMLGVKRFNEVEAGDTRVKVGGVEKKVQVGGNLNRVSAHGQIPCHLDTFPISGVRNFKV
jgi:hypothetical protein